MHLPRIDIANRSVQKVLVVTALLLGLAFAYFATSVVPFCYRPREAKVRALRERVARLVTEVEQAKRTAANLPRLEQEMDVLHARWEQATNLLPPEKEVAALLRKVTVAGHQAGVEFLVFEPSTPVPKTFYTEHPVSVKVRGGYHDFGTFLARLANMTRIVNVSDLDLKGLVETMDRTRRDARERDDTVEASLTVTAYSLGATEAAAVAESAAKPAGPSRGSGPIGTGRKESPDASDE